MCACARIALQALLAAGGSKGKLGIWNTLELEEIQAKLPAAEAALGSDGRVLSGAVAGMGALDVNSSSDEEGEDGEGGGSGGVARKKGAAAGATGSSRMGDGDERVPCPVAFSSRGIGSCIIHPFISGCNVHEPPGARAR